MYMYSLGVGNKFEFVNKYGLGAKLHLLNFYSRSCWSTPRVCTAREKKERDREIYSFDFFLLLRCVGRKLQILKPTLTHCSLTHAQHTHSFSVYTSIICAHHSAFFFGLFDLVRFCVLFSLLGLIVSNSFGSVCACVCMCTLFRLQN